MKTKTNKNTSKVFRPLIASSLVVALGVSVVTATCPSGSTPSICYGQQTADQTFNTGNPLLTWGDINGQAYSPKVGNGSQTFIDNLVFKFTNEDPSKTPTAEATKGIYQEEEIEKEYQKYIISMGAGANKDVSNNDLDAPIASATNTISTLKFDAGQKTIKLGEFGDGTITLDFGDFTSNGKRHIEINFDENTDASQLGAIPSPFATPMNGNYSLVGNIAILSGDEATYKIDFTHSMRGDITIYTNSFRNWSKYISGTNGEIVFAKGANLEGSIRSRVNDGDANTIKGGVKITFGDSASSSNQVTGDISLINGTNTIEFKGNGTIGGSLVAGGSGYVEGSQANADGSYHEAYIYGQNTVTFGGTGSIGNVSSNTGYNHITATTSLQMANIDASSYAENTFYAPIITLTGTQVTNDASKNIFKANEAGTGDLKITASDTLLTVEGGMTAINTIETTGSLTLNLKGVKNQGNWNSNNQNIIIGGENSQITIGKSGISIANGHSSRQTKNQFTLGNNSSVALSGNINASNNGANIFSFDTKGTINFSGITNATITADEGGQNIFYSPDLTITGNVTIQNDASKNIFKANEAGTGDLKITASDTLLTVEGGMTAINTIETTGSLTLNLKGVKNQGNWNSNNQNIIIGGENSQITIGKSGISIANGHSSRQTKNQFTLGNNSSVALSGNINASNNGANIFSFDTKGTINFSGITNATITADEGGQNIFYSPDLKITASETTLIALGGTTAINTIETTGSLTLNLKGIEANGNANSKNQNIIRGGSNSTITVGQRGIYAHYGSNLGDENIIELGSGSELKFNSSADMQDNTNGNPKISAISTRAGKNTITVDTLTMQQDSNNSAILARGIYTEASGINLINAKTINAKVKWEGIWANDGGSNIVTANTITLESASYYGIVASNGENTITAKTIAIASGSNYVSVHTGRDGNNNFYGNDITLKSSNELGIWVDNNARTNFAIQNNGSLKNLDFNGTSNRKLRTNDNAITTITFEGNGTLQTDITDGTGSSNKNIINLGVVEDTLSTSPLVVAFQGAYTNNSNRADIFSFNQDNFTFSVKNATGSTYQGLTFESARENAINFNATSGVFDLCTNNLSISGNLAINLNQENSTNTIKVEKVSTSGSGTTNINFNAIGTTLKLGDAGDKNLETTGGITTVSFAQENGGTYTLEGAKISTSDSGTTKINFSSNETTFNLKDDGTGTFETTGGTSEISFEEGVTGTFNGVINSTGGIATIKIGDGANGIFTQTITSSGGGATDVSFLAKAPDSVQPETRNALGGTLTLQDGATQSVTNSFGTITADSSYGMVVSGSSSVSNTITTLNVDNKGTVAFYNGTSTIKGFGSGEGTLELTTKTDEVNTLVKLQLTGNGSSNPVNTKILFTGGTDDQRYRSTLEVVGADNTITSLESQATNAVVKLDGSTNASAVNITEAITITKGHSLLFSLTSGASGTAIATAQGGITVEDGGTLGVAIGAGTVDKKVLIGSGNGDTKVDFQEGSTLQVDFLSGASGTVTLGGDKTDPIEIGLNRKSIINFHDSVSNGAQLAGGLKIAGGDNTVNFLGDATLSSVTFTSGTNTINVYDDKTGTIKLGDSGAGDGLANMTNTINLKSGSTLDVQQNGSGSGSGTLTASSADKPSTLNFIGDNATFKGGFKAQDTGKALINVGLGTQKSNSVLEVVSGTITGEVTGADLAFNAGKSTLTLQRGTNTFKTLTSNAKDGILKLDATNSSISAQISGDILIDTDTSLTFDLTSKNTNSATATIAGNITVKNGGTLGIAIGGNGNGTRSVTINGGGTPTLEEGSTLRVDFLKDASGTASLGSGSSGFTIKAGRNSEINFYGGSGTPSLTGGITLDGGTNTANFYGSATLKGIELESGKNYINVKADDQTGITATVDTSKITGKAGLTNYINLENKATIDLQNNNSGSGSGSITASVTVSGSETKVKGSLRNSSITFDKAIADLTLQGENTITTLTGFATPASYIRQGRVVTPTVENTLILDGNNDSSAEIKNSVTSDTVGLKFASGSHAKTFTFSASGNTISNVLFDTSASTNNTLAFTNGASTIAQAMDVGTGNGLTIALGSDQINTTSDNPISLNLVGGFKNTDTGTATLSIKGKDNVSAVVSGADINIKNLDLVAAQSANFAIKNASATFGALTANHASTLTLDGSENAVNVVVNTLKSDKLTTNFAGQGEGQEATLSISSGASDQTITLAGVSVADGSTHNTLDLSALTTATVTNGIEVKGSAESAKGLTIKLKDTELALAGGMTTSNATTTVRVEGTATGAGATISGGTIQITNLDMAGAGALKTTLKATSTEIATLTAQGETSNTLIVDGTSSSAKGVVDSIVGENLQVELNGDSNSATLAIDGVGGTIKSLSATNGKANILSLQSGKLVVTDKITDSSVASNKGLNLEFTGNSELSVAGGIDTSISSGTGVVNISVKGTTTPSTREAEEGGEEITPQPIPTEGIISGGDIKIATLNFENNTTLQVRNANATFATVSGSGILSLDGANTKNGVKATVTSEITNSNNAITANFNGRTDKGNELVLSNDATLKTITFGANSVNNKISVANSKTLTLSDQVVLNSGSGITFALANGSTLDLKQGMSSKGTSTLRVEAGSSNNNESTLKGGTFTSNAREASSENSESVTTGTEITNLDLISYVDSATSTTKAAKLTIQASDVTIGKVTAQEGTTTLALNATNGNVLTTINAISGKTLALELNGDSHNATLALRGKGNPVKSLKIEGTKNLLDLDNASIAIADKVTIDANKALNVDLVSGRYVPVDKKTEIDSGTMTFNFNSGLSEIGGAGINVKSGGTLNLKVGVKDTSGARALIGALSKEASGTVNLTFNGDANTFFFDPTSAGASKLEITTLKSNGNGNTVDIASSRFGTNFDVNYTRKDFRVLKIGDNTADTDATRNTLNFKVFVDKTQSGSLTIGSETISSNGQASSYGYAYSDRIILNTNGATKPTTHNLLIIPKIDQLGKITYNGGGTEVANNVAVATVKNKSGVSFATEKVISGFEVIQAELVAVGTDEKGMTTNGGNKDYTTYFLGSVQSVGTSTEMQEAASTALSINYDLYMANLNSLNKRMGELRDNPYNQGVWARVFGGTQESSFGIGSKTDYVTIQAGYDYDLSFGNAKNYIGVAFSYATSTSKSFNVSQSITNSNASASNVVGIDNIKSGAYEVAVYNSYVADSGWYNDSIAKFSYIDSTFNLTDTSYDSQTTNMAFTLSNEVGYRYKFAENEKGNWYIDPQLEMAFGYLNQSDFNSKIASSAVSSGYSSISAYQDSIMTLRTRVGASLGKKFNTQKGFASVYVGAFYEYDYVEGGSSDVGVGSGATNTLTPLSSSGRAVVNVGSNIALTENARLYIDVEKSFGDKFKTHMQFNFGARYSFGEKAPTALSQENKSENTPLKVSALPKK